MDIPEGVQPITLFLRPVTRNAIDVGKTSPVISATVSSEKGNDGNIDVPSKVIAATTTADMGNSDTSRVTLPMRKEMST